MSREALAGLIWATRGRSWGFRFLLDAGLHDPLPAYEDAFSDLQDQPTAWRRSAGSGALRFPDPLRRQDSAGRLIPHEFVVFEPLAGQIETAEQGVELIWPLVEGLYARVWDIPRPPTPDDLGQGPVSP